VAIEHLAFHWQKPTSLAEYVYSGERQILSFAMFSRTRDLMNDLARYYDGSTVNVIRACILVLGEIKNVEQQMGEPDTGRWEK